ncbi:MAG: alpha/beta fold hydrolase [Acidobacteriota bacterium]
MGAPDLIRLLTFFRRLNLPRWPRRAAARIVEEHDLSSPSGALYDHYLPRSTVRSRIVALHGVTRKGKDDPRLVRFSRSLASAGVECFVPTLRGLAEFDWRGSDIDDLVALVLGVAGGARSLGVVGFSFGGSYALVAAARSEISQTLRFVLAVGAYHSLVDLYERVAAVGADGRFAGSRGDMDDWIYLHLVAARRLAPELRLDPATLVEMDSLLDRYCHSSSLPEKTSFYERHLEGRNLLQQDWAMADRAVLERLSPATRLRSVACPVRLLHDPEDAIVPADHAHKIAAELGRWDRSCRLVVTPLLHHVSLSSALMTADWVRIAALFLPVMAMRPGKDESGAD